MPLPYLLALERNRPRHRSGRGQESWPPTPGAATYCKYLKSRTHGPVPLTPPFGGLLDQTEIGEFRDVQRFLDESEVFDLVDARLHDLQVGLGIEVAMEIALGEQPALQGGRRPLEEARSQRHRLLVVGRVVVPAQRRTRVF